MTDLETQVEALMQTLHTTPVSWEGSEAGPNISVILTSDVRALVTALVQEKANLQANAWALSKILANAEARLAAVAALAASGPGQ